MTATQDDMIAELQRTIAELRQDREAALARETALAEVLEVINRSPSDAKPVFDMILEKAHRLCGADLGAMITYDGVDVQTVVSRGYSEVAAALVRGPSPPSPAQQTLIAGERYRHIPDVRAVEIGPDQGFAGSIAEITGLRTFLMVPLRKDGIPRGFLTAHRLEVRPFSEQDIALLESFAVQAVIAMENARLLGELQERTAALAQRNTQYSERIEHQAATIDVLKVMSASPGDAQPVFDLIVRQAKELCNCMGGALYEYDGELVHLRTNYGGDTDAATVAKYIAMFPMAPTRASFACRAIMDREVVHIRDTDAEPEQFAVMRDLERKAQISVPLLRDGVAIGAIALGAEKAGGFSDSQVALLQTFAEQAVIAISSAETYRALQTRTSDLQESLEYQTATSDVLKVISRSTFDLQPVLDTVVATATRLCDADQAMIFNVDDGVVHLTANIGFPPEYQDSFDARGLTRLAPNSPGVLARAVRERRVVHVHDAAAVPGYPEAAVKLRNVRTALGVPFLRDDEPIGVIVLSRKHVEPFTEQQIALVSTFADQAVIAMENARLITEQREALEQQTATAEVLQVINASPGNLAPVFDAVLEKAVRLCQSSFGILGTYDGECIHNVATCSAPPALADFLREPIRPSPGTSLYRIVHGEDVVHIPDIVDDEAYRLGIPSRRALTDLGGARTLLLVALRKDETLLGLINVYRQEVRPFTDKQIALLESFAAQAVIAMENARLLTEQREALEQQTATAEVLQVINASPGNLAPVFEAILEKAHDLCDIAHGDLQLYDGEHLHSVAQRGLSAEFADRLRQGYRASDSPASRPLLAGDRFTHITDAAAVDFMVFRSSVRPDGIRTVLFVPLRKDGSLLGMITSARREVRPFTEKEISLLENFAAQAVIAMENARLINEQREALEQQTATAEVLQVINSSPGDLAPVFDAMLQKATDLCDAAFGILWTFDGEHYHAVAFRNVPPAYSEFLRDPPPATPLTPLGRIAAGEAFAQIADMADEIFAAGGPLFHRAVALAGFRTIVGVSLRKDAILLGAITIYREEVRPFSDKQIALLQSFAAQAVIAMENARLLDEIRQRQEELRVTFENMGDGVAMFDETQYLAAWNRKFQDILDLPDALLEQRRTYEEHLRFLAARGDFGPGVDTVEQIEELVASTGQPYGYERTRPDGRVIEIRRNPVPDGGFVLIYSDITERKRSEEQIRAARDAAETALRELKTAQANLIQAEKMASLGQLTAGIAHEIKNPLNFVNNFSALSTELIDELREVLAPEPLGVTARTEVDDLTALLKGNLEKVVQHGQRADGIVRSMLDHSRGSSGERRMVNLNALIDEALNLAYHGARAQDQSFNITLERDFGGGIAPIEVNPQDITRVFLNLFSNGFYATTKRARDGGAGFEPTLKITTHDAGDAVEIRVRDNGTGIPADIRDKLFQPFFTTKPTGEGTGLGLSITYDIVTQQHGGSIAMDSEFGDYSEFTIRLPRGRA